MLERRASDRERTYAAVLGFSGSPKGMTLRWVDPRALVIEYTGCHDEYRVRHPTLSNVDIAYHNHCPSPDPPKLGWIGEGSDI